ncbi:Uma2 family endonuclease [Streptomyces sp. NPDC058335]|uniref:Uma2 family endonuclease n=1 Tax=Streptomyces sp. NPDC058335 TaxID=3346451 RepID=UPI003659FB95
MAKFRDGAAKDDAGRWKYEDIEFIGEVISRGTAPNDYGAKKTAYAVAGVPLYLIADPYLGRCTVYTEPKDGGYQCEPRVDYGTDVDLTTTALDLTLKTDTFPRD